MGAYDNDSRVTRVNQGFYRVVTPSDSFDVSASASPTDWWIEPDVSSRTIRQANIRTRADAEAWCARTERGPFRSADAAIRQLIGAPR